MQNDFKKLFVITLASLTVSCAPVKIRDREVYGDMGKFGATKVHTLFTDIPPQRIYKQEWDNLRIGMVCTKAEDINDLILIIDKLCTRHKNECDYEKFERAKEALRTLQVQMSRFN